ncbi:MAG TPA: GNAT family N-acetyltransferase [Frankiaceae bacterium]|nr:GNAT family N-acetyltransferase [Frankiaceae bacterium]
MTRSVTVREAAADDVPALVTLLGQLRDEGLRRRVNGTESDEQVAGRVELALADPDARVIVAVYDDEIIGMAQLMRTRATLLSDAPAVELTAMHVANGHRRRGAGKSLVTAAVTFADELAAESVVVSVFPQHREANRFFARLGFAPYVVRRFAPVPALRRKLGSPEGRAALLRRELHVPRRPIARNRPRRLVHPAPVGDKPTD